MLLRKRLTQIWGGKVYVNTAKQTESKIDLYSRGLQGKGKVGHSKCLLLRPGRKDGSIKRVIPAVDRNMYRDRGL